MRLGKKKWNKLKNKLVLLESYKYKLRDKEEEINILNNHINDISLSHSFALEKLTNVTKELEIERNTKNRVSAPFSLAHWYEDDLNQDSNASIDYHERGNFNDDSRMTENHMINHCSPKEDSKLTLQDELEMLNYDVNDFGDDGGDIFGSGHKINKSLHHEENELARIFHNETFDQEDHDIEECKTPVKKQISYNSNSDEKVLTNKDLIIDDLKNKLKIEREIKESYQKKSVDYMIDFIKAEKRRKEIEIYLGIKNKRKRGKAILYFLAAFIAFVLIVLYWIIYN